MTAPDAALDTIALRGLCARGFHGVFEHERRDGQDFITDVLLNLDAGPAGSHDDLASTANYAEVAATVERIVSGEPADLIETVALRIATSVLQEQPVVASVEVTVHKPQAPIPSDFADVSVTVRRSRT